VFDEKKGLTELSVPLHPMPHLKASLVVV